MRLTTAGEITLANVGVEPTISTTPIDSLPGSFECSDDEISKIWRVGARTIQMNEIPAYSIPPFWKISHEGSYVESQAPQALSLDSTESLMEYEINFHVKPIQRGFSFSVLTDTLNSGIYIWFNIANGTISASFGATEANSELLAFATLSPNITIGDWHHIRATINITEITISANNVEVLKFIQTASTYGSFGLGAPLGHSCLFKNLTATDGVGTLLYSSSLTEDSFLSDFLMGTNLLPTTVDGSTRDRIAYAGDLDVAVGSSQTLPHNGLLNISDPMFGGDWNYYDPSQSGVVTKFNAIYAYSLQSCLTLLADAYVDTAIYISRLNALRIAIDTHLWSDELKAYYVSESMQGGFGQDSNAFAILAGVTNMNHTSSQVLDTLKSLYTPSGPLAFSNGTVSSGFRKLISPYASSYHLRAALSVGDGVTAKVLLQSLWKPMADPMGPNYTGCFWETLNATGGLGLGPATSPCHAWGSGPTGELSAYVLGM